jgi:putative sigma-54 modulation protein
MKVQVQSVNFSADTKLIDFIQRRMDKLEQYYDRIIDGEVYLKVDNNHTKENKIAEIRVNIPGHEMIVKKQCKSFEHATDMSTDALTRQLKKYKERARLKAS